MGNKTGAEMRPSSWEVIPVLNETKGSWFQMRSKSRMVVVALVAVFALSAVAASSALASPEWYVKKAGKYEKVTEVVKVGGTLSFEAVIVKSVFGETGAISCKMNATGELKPGGKSAITGLSEVKCEYHKECGFLEKLEPHGLPWQVELYKEGSEIRSKFVSVERILRMSCKWTFTGSEEINTAFPSSHVSNILGTWVESAFDAKSAKTLWNEDKIEWKGSFVTVKPLEKSGVEAIKVE